MKTGFKVLFTLGAVAIGGAGCDNSSTAATVRNPTVMVLSDAEGAALISRLNAGQVEAAQVFRPLAAHDDVIGFADRMIDEHTRADGMLLATGVAEQPSAVSIALDEDFALLNQAVQQAGAVDAEVVYVNSQVALHQQALLLLDCALIPGTTSETFRDFVFAQVRPKVREGLEASSQLATQLQARTGGGIAGALTPALPGDDRCDAACDPQQSTGFSVGVRDAVCR